MYQFESRVRYSEIGEDKKMTLQSLLNYLQDCCTFHSESIGLGLEAEEKRGCAWVLSAWQIEVNRYPDMGEPITVETWPYAFRGFLGDRNFRILGADQEVLAYANSHWAHIDLKTGLPVRMSEEEMHTYQTEPKLDMEYAPRKIPMPAVYEEQEAFPVKKHHIDTNHHVNNARYIRLAQDYLPDGFKTVHLRAEYKKQALLGDVIYPLVSREGDRVVVALTDKEKNPYALVEFRQEEKS